LRWRATEPAFDGTFELLDSPGHVISVRWSGPDSTITIDVDVATGLFTVDPPLT